MAGIFTTTEVYLTNGVDLLEDFLSNNVILSTGNASLDDSLHGGIATSEITEVVSNSPAANTDFCYQIASSAAVSQKANTLYLDTASGFSARRFQHSLESRSEDLSESQLGEVLERLRHISVFNVFEMLRILFTTKQALCNEMDEFCNNLRVIVVDNIVALLSDCVGGKQQQGYYLINQIGQVLKSIAIDHHVAVLVANGAICDGSTIRPMLGRAWNHIPSTRLLIRASENPHQLSFSVGKILRSGLQTSTDVT